jgi:hypothetical protein
MALQASGPISMSNINVEIGRASNANLALTPASQGAYVTLNVNSASRPDGTNPQKISEWYGYNHTAVAPDTTPPTTPFLDAIGDFGGGFLRLTWSTSTDASGIAYYDVYREENNSGVFGVIGQPTATTFDDINVFDGNGYAYKIKAIDNAFNQSAFSNTQSIFYSSGGGPGGPGGPLTPV